MKKLIALICAVCALVCVLTACGEPKNPDPSPDSSVKDEYDNLNSMLALSYSEIEITVDNTFTEEDITLESVYTVKYAQSKITVEYKVERFAEISFENPTGGLKTVLSGTAEIKDGVISQNDAGITADIATLSINFKEEYFENAELTSMYFKAGVKDASGFMGTDINCTDMRAEATFLDCFYDLTVSYKQAGHEVEYKYLFTL